MLLIFDDFSWFLRIFRIFQIFKVSCKAPKISGDPLQIFLSSNRSKASICRKNMYVRTPGTKCPALKWSTFFHVLTIFPEKEDFADMLFGVPDVRRYLSGFWGVILMLLNIFHYLSNGGAPLIDDLGAPAFSWKSCIIYTSVQLKMQQKTSKNAIIFVFW